MTTVKELTDSVFRRYLEPPDAQPAVTHFASGCPIGATDFFIESFEVPEDEELIRQGSIIEASRELMRVVNYNDNDKVLTVRRAQLGTYEENHLVGEPIKLSPPYPRSEVFAAIAQNIISLYPKLWMVRTEVLGSVGQGTYVLDDPLAVEVVSVNIDSPQGTPLSNFHGQIVNVHPRTGARTIQLNVDIGTTIWARYRRRMAEPLTEDQDLYDLGVEEVWRNVVMVGAAADILAGRDIPASHVEWVGGVLQAENIPVGTRGQISVGLARYRELLIERFANEMKGEDSNSIRVQMSDPFAQVV